MKLGGQVEAALDKIAYQIVGKTNSASHCKIIQQCFRPFGVKVEVVFDDLVPKNTIIITGAHSPWRVRQKIEIFLNYNSDSRRCRITKAKWNNLRFDLSQVLQHELIHKEQCSYMVIPGEEWEDHHCKVYASKSKVPHIKQNQEYFGSTEEIKAHAHCIMMELIKLSPRTDPTKLLKRASKIPRAKSPTLKNYFEAFDYDVNHPVMKRLLKQVVYWIEQGT